MVGKIKIHTYKLTTNVTFLNQWNQKRWKKLKTTETQDTALVKQKLVVNQNETN